MVAITSSGELVVTEHWKISIFSRDGKRIRSINNTCVGSGIKRYKLDPWGVALDEDSNIYLSNTGDMCFPNGAWRAVCFEIVDAFG